MLDSAMKIKDQLVSWRRDFHMHPELGFEENRTARIVADTLKDFGIRVDTGVGVTGVVGHLGEGSPVVGIRADMDALPLQEANNVPYASQNPGVMHACGHDAHTAILLGVARILSEMPDRPPGEIRFLFSAGWGEGGADQAILVIRQNAAGIYYWQGILYATGRFADYEYQPSSQAIFEEHVIQAWMPNTRDLDYLQSVMADDFIIAGAFAVDYGPGEAAQRNP